MGHVPDSDPHYMWEMIETLICPFLIYLIPWTNVQYVSLSWTWIWFKVCTFSSSFSTWVTLKAKCDGKHHLGGFYLPEVMIFRFSTFTRSCRWKVWYWITIFGVASAIKQVCCMRLGSVDLKCPDFCHDSDSECGNGPYLEHYSEVRVLTLCIIFNGNTSSFFNKEKYPLESKVGISVTNS